MSTTEIYEHSSENMHEIKNESIHLIITSPPYPMIQKWDDLFECTNWNKQHRILDPIWEECKRILIPGGICCINIGDATRTIDKNFECYPNCARVILKMKSIGFTPLIPIYWRKISNRPNSFIGSGMLPPNGYISQDCEYIAIFRKGMLRKFPVKDENRLASSFTKDERDIWFQQLWNIQGAHLAGKTSSFPEEIPYRLIRMFSVIGDTVVDPFSGHHTTGEVAKKLDRNYIGYEIKRRVILRGTFDGAKN